MEKPSYVVGLIAWSTFDNIDAVVAVSRRGKPEDLGLPGGSIEPTDADPYAALCREVLEETGVKVLEATHVFSRVDATDGKIAWAYEVTEWEGVPRKMEPGIEVSWENPGRLLEHGCTFREYNEALFKQLNVETYPRRLDQLPNVSDEEYAKVSQPTVEERTVNGLDVTERLAVLETEVRRLRLEAKHYKEECEAVCEAAEDFAGVSIQYLRGRPGDEHPVMKKLSRMRSLIDRARHIHIFIDSMLRHT